jgi:hypothetical protein
MITHYVCWRVKDAALGLSKAEILRKMKTELEALAGRIPGLVSLRVGLNEKPGPHAADLALFSVFESWAALDTYVSHPEHQAVVAFVVQVAEERRVVDFEG